MLHCTRSARHGTLFPLSVSTLTLRLRADGRCRSVQARLCRKRCGHVIGLGPYLLSMMSLPSALVLGMLDQYGRTPFFLLLGRAILTKRPTSFQ